jgi:uncharacterized metal-binding protein
MFGVKPKEDIPLVYSCSGASSAAQMANHIAIKLDRLKIAEMSCIAGVGGDVKSLVRTAKSGRSIIALDGCPLQCAAHILKRHGLKADWHYDLSKMGVKKKQHKDFDPQEAAQVLQHILTDSGLTGDAISCAGTITAPTTKEGPELSSPVCYLNEFKDW